MPGRRLELTEDPGFQLICGDQGDGVYSIRLSRPGHPDWRMAAGDFLSFHEAMGIPFELALDRRDREDMLEHYTGFSNGEPTHSYNDPYLRAKEPRVLVHSTTTESWDSIREEGELLSWNTLKARGALREQEPIGAALGDPEGFQRLYYVRRRSYRRAYCQLKAEGAPLHGPSYRLSRRGKALF